MLKRSHALQDDRLALVTIQRLYFFNLFLLFPRFFFLLQHHRQSSTKANAPHSEELAHRQKEAESTQFFASPVPHSYHVKNVTPGSSDTHQNISSSKALAGPPHEGAAAALPIHHYTFCRDRRPLHKFSRLARHVSTEDSNPYGCSSSNSSSSSSGLGRSRSTETTTQSDCRSCGGQAYGLRPLHQPESSMEPVEEALPPPLSFTRSISRKNSDIGSLGGSRSGPVLELQFSTTAAPLHRSSPTLHPLPLHTEHPYFFWHDQKELPPPRGS